jgi:MrcB-like, N-terminal domain
MPLRESIEAVLTGYRLEQDEPFAGHRIANLIRNELCEEVASATGEKGRLVCNGSAGQGNWVLGAFYLRRTTKNKGRQ